MSDELTPTTPPPPDDDNLALVALSPADMVPAQTELVAWCDRKLRALADEADELELHQTLAIENGWKTSVVVAALNRTARRITYYSKIKAALEAGYLLVPNMPIDVLAVRVRRAHEPVHHASYQQGVTRATPQASLPAGEGRYVDDRTFAESYQEPVQDEHGKVSVRTRYRTGDYDEVDFPVATMKPVILTAAARAMALKIFDQIGVVANSGAAGRDPILVGQLLDPRGNSRATTFFLAWWVNTRDL